MRYIALVRKGERLRVTLPTVNAATAAFDDEGAALLPSDEGLLHVAGALPGETVDVHIDHVSPHAPRQRWAHTLDVIVPSPDRVTPACPAWGRCGGCPLGHLAYPAQLRCKASLVSQRLATIATAIEPIVGSPAALGYRNRSKLVIGQTGGSVLVGAYAPHSHTLVDLRGCQVVEPPLDEVARALPSLLLKSGLPIYDERTHSGAIRYAILRSNARGEVLCVLVSKEPHEALGPLARALRQRCPSVVGVIDNRNATTGNVLLGATSQLIDGRATLDDELGAARLALSATAFTQVNRQVAALLYRQLTEWLAAAAGERVVDAYGGMGAVAQHVAGAGGQVVVVEHNAAAVADGRRSTTADNIRFVAGDVGTHLSGSEGADVVVLNPPRKGCAAAVLDGAARARRAIGYISCNAETLARDLTYLEARGWKTTRVRAFDMLPQTPHVEVLALCERR